MFVILLRYHTIRVANSLVAKTFRLLEKMKASNKIHGQPCIGYYDTRKTVESIRPERVL